jgi:hypothetical protein
LHYGRKKFYNFGPGRVHGGGLVVDEVKVGEHGAAAAVVGDGLEGVVEFPLRISIPLFKKGKII